MEYRKISANSTSTLFTNQEREMPPIIRTPHSHPQSQKMIKLQKLNQLQNLLRHVYREQEELRQKQEELQEELKWKQEKVKEVLSRRESRVRIQQLDLEGQQYGQEYELENTFNNLYFQRTKKQQFFSVMPSPRQQSLKATKTNFRRTPNLSPKKKESRVGLIRKQSQKCFSQATTFPKRPLIQKLGHFKTMSYGYASIDDLWNQCPPLRPSYVD